MLREDVSVARGSVTWLIAAVLSIFVAAGCGGDGGGESDSPTANQGPSKREFVSRVNGYCAELRQQLLGPKLKAYKQAQQQALEQGNEPPPAASFFRGTVAAGMRRLLEQIRSLTPPAGDENQVNAILDAGDSTVRQIEANPSGVQRVNPPLEVELESRTLDRARVLALDYGLDRCGGSKRP